MRTIDRAWTRWKAKDSEAVVSHVLDRLPSHTRSLAGALGRLADAGVIRQALDTLSRGGMVDPIILTQDLGLQPGDLQQVITEAFREAGRFTTELLGARSVTFSLSFDDIDPHAVEWLRTRSSSLIAHISGSMRETVRQVLSEALAEGLTGPQTAARLRDVIPLRPDQLRRLNAYRASLSVSPARAQELVSRFAGRLLDERAELIARTELVAAANAGQMEVWRQAIGGGLLPPLVMKRWSVYAGCCERCAAVSAAGPIPLDQDFVSQGWEVEAPPLHPRCRCAVVLDVPDPTLLL